jgi:hypothetical protein
MTSRGAQYQSSGTADYVRPYVRRMAGPGPHLAQRPNWQCRVCHDPWPCEPAKLLLLMEYRQNMVSLSIYMAGIMTDAVQDMVRLHPNPGPDSAELFERFLAWTNPRAHPPHTTQPPAR